MRRFSNGELRAAQQAVEGFSTRDRMGSIMCPGKNLNRHLQSCEVLGCGQVGHGGSAQNGWQQLWADGRTQLTGPAGLGRRRRCAPGEADECLHPMLFHHLGRAEVLISLLGPGGPHCGRDQEAQRGEPVRFLQRRAQLGGGSHGGATRVDRFARSHCLEQMQQILGQLRPEIVIGDWSAGGGSMAARVIAQHSEAGELTGDVEPGVMLAPGGGCQPVQLDEQRVRLLPHHFKRKLRSRCLEPGHRPRLPVCG